jgi:hypothetical protein
MEVCGIRELSQSALRSGVQRSCVVKQYHQKQVMSSEPAATSRVVEDRAMVFSDVVVN